MISNKIQKEHLNKLSDAIKILSAEAVEKAQSGHPGMAIGFAQVMTNLAANFLKFNPHDPKWFNRDRLVLSAGHGSMLLYSFFYLAGYKGFGLDDIKNFRQLGSKAAGHPENHLYNAIETSTGPLGQGLANAVGMAIAQKKLKAKLGNTLCDYKIYVIVGDGCLMEGVAYEALSLAGHLSLDNLVILFDSNNITIDGQAQLCHSENHLAKMKALGFEAMSVDGHDQDEISRALSWCQDSQKPSFVEFKTLIAKGCATKENSSKAHGSPLGAQEISSLKISLKWQESNFEVGEEVMDIWRNIWLRNEKSYQEWQDFYNHADESSKEYISGTQIKLFEENEIPAKDEATRVSSGKIIAKILEHNEKVIIGSADLAGSNNLINPHVKNITREDFNGNFINYGIREHAMAAIMNGLALSSFIPMGGTFLVFSDYMRPAMRLAALMELPVIYVLTHDSIGVGEDGPTHQPIEHLASFRAMPGINLFRPADYAETYASYHIALNDSAPAIFTLSRQSTKQLVDISKSKMVKKGGYIISPESNKQKLDITIFASGTEVSLAIEVQKKLANQGVNARICSVPCFDILLQQPAEYIEELKGGAKKLAAIEAGCDFGWHKIIGSDGLFFGVNRFGASAPAKDLYEYFGLTADNIAAKL